MSLLSLTLRNVKVWDLSLELLPVSWSFRPYRTCLPCLSSVIHEQHVPCCARDVPLLSPFQGQPSSGKQNLSQHSESSACSLKLTDLQKIKFAGKLKLLEHGLLEEAQALDTMPFEGTGHSGGKRLETGGEDDDEEDEEDAIVEQYEGRIDTYVRAALLRASGSKRDSYKDNMVYQARKDLIAGFNKIALAKKCARCAAYVSCSPWFSSPPVPVALIHFPPLPTNSQCMY